MSQYAIMKDGIVWDVAYTTEEIWRKVFSTQRAYPASKVWLVPA